MNLKHKKLFDKINYLIPFYNGHDTMREIAVKSGILYPSVHDYTNKLKDYILDCKQITIGGNKVMLYTAKVESISEDRFKQYFNIKEKDYSRQIKDSELYNMLSEPERQKVGKEQGVHTFYKNGARQVFVRKHTGNYAAGHITKSQRTWAGIVDYGSM